MIRCSLCLEDLFLTLLKFLENFCANFVQGHVVLDRNKTTNTNTKKHTEKEFLAKVIQNS